MAYTPPTEYKDYYAMLQAMEKARKGDEWNVYVTQNASDLRRTYSRWYRHTLTRNELLALAKGQGKLATTLYARLNEATRLEQYVPAFHSLNGKNPTLAQARSISKQFTSGAEYENWLNAGQQAKSAYPEIKELFGTYSSGTPSYAKTQQMFAGRAGSEVFKRNYEAFRARKEAAFKPEATQIPTAIDKTTGLLNQPQVEYEY